MGTLFLLMLTCLGGLTSAISNTTTSGIVIGRHESNNGSIPIYAEVLSADSLQSNTGSIFVESTNDYNTTVDSLHGINSLAMENHKDNNGLIGINRLDTESHKGNNDRGFIDTIQQDTNNSVNNNVSRRLEFPKLNADNSVNTTASLNVSSITMMTSGNTINNSSDLISSHKLHNDIKVNNTDTMFHLNLPTLSKSSSKSSSGSILRGASQDGSSIAGTAFEILGDISTVAGKIFPEIAPVTTILSGIFGIFSKLFGSESAELQLLKQELKLMKHEFGEINMKLDTITKDLDLIKNLIVDSNLKSAYIVDENAILNGFLKLDTLVDELGNISCSNANDCARQRMDIEARYLPYLDVSQNMDNIYRGAMDKTTVFSEPLLDRINETYKCDVPKIKKFTDGIIKLAFKEQQVTMVFNMLSGSPYSITNALQNWMIRMFKLDDYSKQITRQCLDNIKQFMLMDIKAPKYQSGYNTSYEAAKAARNDLLEKYNWLDWVVMAFDTDKDTVFNAFDIDGIFWSFPGVNKGRRNIIASFIDKGTFKTDVKEEIAEVLNGIAAGQEDFNYFISHLKDRDVWKFIKSITVLDKEHNWHYAKDSNHYERILEQTFGSTRLFITLKSEEERIYFKSDEHRMSLVRCSLPCGNNIGSCKQCLNDGVCNHLPYSTNFFCNCKHYFYGQYCQLRSNITMAKNLEEMFNHTMKIPKLTDINFEIKDLRSYIGTSLGNVRKAINKVATVIGKAFVQLQDIQSQEFRLLGVVSTYGEQIASLQYYIGLFDDVMRCTAADDDPGLRDLAEAVLGAQHYNGIRRWLHDFNNLINGTSGFTLTPVEPLLITYMDRFKSYACAQKYKDAIDNVWRELILLQQRGYMIWIQALHILNEPTDFAVRQYKDYTSSQIETMKAKTCNLDIPGSKSLNCSGGYYMNERIELTVSCLPNYHLVGNAPITCSNKNTSCYFCGCSSYGAVSQQCEDQTGKCHCNSTYYGNKCENKDCVWSSWGAWSPCPCGYANQTRNRSLIEPEKGAGICLGELTQTRTCFQNCCSQEFHCNQSSECIPESQHCNKRQDCQYNEDESDCCETRHTPWYDNGGGSTWALDHHHIDCGSPLKMITKFGLEASPHPKQLIRYNYVCCRFSTPVCEKIRLVNNTATEGSEQIIYLDKQHVDCGNDSIINSFSLNQEMSYNPLYNYYTFTGRWYYQYKCCDIEPAFEATCWENNSSWTTEGSAKNFFLGRQDFQCQDNSSLSYFHLERNYPGHNMIRYNYRCCFV